MKNSQKTKKNGFLTALSIAVAIAVVTPTQSVAYDPSAKTTSSNGNPSQKLAGSIGSALGGLGNIGGFLDELDLNGKIDSILGSIGDFDGGIGDIFNDFDIGNIFGDMGQMKDILGCFGVDPSSMDLSSITGDLSGLCSLGNFGDIGGFDLSKLGCLTGGSGSNSSNKNPLDKISGLQDKLGKLCGKASSSSGGSTGGTGGSGGSTGGTGGSGGSTGGSEYVAPTEYSSGMATATTGSTVAGVGVGSDVKDNNVGNAKTPSGDPLSVIDGKDGGIINKVRKEKPNSSTAKAYRDMDKYTLTLQRLVAMNAKKADDEQRLDTRTFGLPATPLDVIQQENDMANLRAGFYVDLRDIQNKIVNAVRAKYQSISTETLSEYYIQEKKVFNEYIKKDFAPELEKIRLGAYKQIEAKWTARLFNMVSDKDYLFDTSNEQLKALPKNLRNKFIVKAMVQMNKETEIKARIALEKAELKEAIDRAIQRAYPASSVFRGDIAKKEIDKLLKAVDTAIQ